MKMFKIDLQTFIEIHFLLNQNMTDLYIDTTKRVYPVAKHCVQFSNTVQ